MNLQNESQVTNSKIGTRRGSGASGTTTLKASFFFQTEEREIEKPNY